MRITDREKSQYINEIKSLLVCNNSRRKQFLSSFSDNVDDYITNNPEADITQLENDMGTPLEIADNFLATDSSVRIKKKMNLVRWVVIFLVIALAIYACVMANLLVIANKDANGYATETITYEETISDGQLED